MKIEIEKLARPVQSGDWHDKPLKWGVAGPGVERQLFVTKKNAELYARIRRKAADAREAENEYVRRA